MTEETPVQPENQPGTGAPVSAPPQTNALAIAALILGIVSIPLIFVCAGWATAAAGLVLGIIALVKIKDSQGQMKGKGMAITGIVTSVLAVIIYVIFIVVLANSEMGKGNFNIPELESAIEQAVEEAAAQEAARDSTN